MLECSEAKNVDCEPLEISTLKEVIEWIEASQKNDETEVVEDEEEEEGEDDDDDEDDDEDENFQFHRNSS
jgi:hypothetical protein